MVIGLQLSSIPRSVEQQQSLETWLGCKEVVIYIVFSGSCCSMLRWKKFTVTLEFTSISRENHCIGKLSINFQ